MWRGDPCHGDDVPRLVLNGSFPHGTPRSSLRAFLVNGLPFGWIESTLWFDRPQVIEHKTASPSVHQSGDISAGLSHGFPYQPETVAVPIAFAVMSHVSELVTINVRRLTGMEDLAIPFPFILRLRLVEENKRRIGASTELPCVWRLYRPGVPEGVSKIGYIGLLSGNEDIR